MREGGRLTLFMRVSIIATGVVLVLSSISSTAPSVQPQKGGTFRTFASSRIGKIDTITSQATFIQHIVNQVFGALVTYRSGTWDLVPDLAEKWTVSRDGRRYTFTLRGGSRFHDGTPITADDAAFSLRRAAGPGSVWRSRFQNVSDIRVVDSRTLEIVLNGRDPFFLNRIAGAGGSGILPRRVVEAHGDRFGTTVETLVGSGPFRVVEKTDTQLVYEPSPHWYEPIYVERVIQRVIPDPNTQTLEFDAGNVDWMFSILSAEVEQKYAADARYRESLKRGLSSAAFWFGMNPRQKPFDDIRVRRAIAHTLDVVPAVRAGGQGVPAYSLVHPLLPGHDANLRVFRRDPNRARSLLLEAGYPRGLKFDAYVWNIPGFVAMAEVLQQQLREAGHDVGLRTVEFATFLSEANKGSYGFFINLGNISVPDTAEFLYSFFHSRGPFNISYQNPEVDRLLSQAVRASDLKTRANLSGRANRAIIEDVIAIPLQFRLTATVFQPWVRGHEMHNQTEGSGQTYLRWSQLWLDPSRR